MGYESKVLSRLAYTQTLRTLTCCASCPLASWSKEGEDFGGIVVGYCKELYRDVWRSQIGDQASSLENKPKTQCDSREQALDLLNSAD